MLSIPGIDFWWFNAVSAIQPTFPVKTCNISPCVNVWGSKRILDIINLSQEEETRISYALRYSIKLRTRLVKKEILSENYFDIRNMTKGGSEVQHTGRGC